MKHTMASKMFRDKEKETLKLQCQNTSEKKIPGGAYAYPQNNLLLALAFEA